MSDAVVAASRFQDAAHGQSVSWRSTSELPMRRTATRADLLDAIYSRCPGLSRSQTREIFEMALEEVSQSLVKGEAVKLRSFGLFSVREKRERIGRNPRTGIEVPIKPRRVLTFRPSPVLFGLVNGQTPDKNDNGANDIGADDNGADD